MSESAKPANNPAGTPPRFDGEPALEFPDWSGKKRAPSTLAMDEMLRYCEAALSHIRSFPGWPERRMKDRCDVEFILKD